MGASQPILKIRTPLEFSARYLGRSWQGFGTFASLTKLKY
jgi:hypothetical protein